ncbi:hypothetical protein CL622_07360 [archaeon]|nr:hypothetical protein [archaeon]
MVQIKEINLDLPEEKNKLKKLKHFSIDDIYRIFRWSVTAENLKGYPVKSKSIIYLIGWILNKLILELPLNDDIKKRNKGEVNIFNETHNDNELEDYLENNGINSLYSGYEEIDKCISFNRGQFIIIQALSNHGKTSFKLNLLYRFICSKKNNDKKVVCHFFSYESTHILLKIKLINIWANKKVVKYSPSTKCGNNQKQIGNYFITDLKLFSKVEKEINDIMKKRVINIYKNTYNLDEIIKLMETNFENDPDITHVYFFDYIQIIETKMPGDNNWLKLQNLSTQLAKLSIKFNCIVIASSQLSEDGSLAESKGMYRPADIIIDLFNNSQALIKDHKSKHIKQRFIEEENGIMHISIKSAKQRYGQNFNLEDSFQLVEGDFLKESITKKKPKETPERKWGGGIRF